MQRFSDFTALSFEDWCGQIANETKQTNPSELLQKFSRYGLKLNALYNTKNALAGLNSTHKYTPEFFKPNEWYIEVNVFATPNNELKDNELILNLLQKGCNALRIVSQEAIDYNKLLKEVKTEYILCSVVNYHQLPVSKSNFVALKDARIVNRTLNTAHSANFWVEQTLNQLEIDLNPVSNAGLLPINQLLMLMLLLEHKYQANEFDGVEVFDLRHAVGSELLLEVAKIRAARYLIAQWKMFNNIKTEFRHSGENLLKDWGTSSRELNLIRAGNSVIASALAGCEIISSHPNTLDYAGYNYILNIHQLAINEAHLAEVYDPLMGASLIEGYTKELIESVWQKFTNYLEQGTPFDGLKYIETMLQEDRLETEKAIAKIGKKRIAETSFVNPLNQTAYAAIELFYPSLKFHTA